MDSSINLNEILEKHKKWLNGEQGGEMADLGEANLRGADLRGADLRGADLRGAYLYGADLRGAYLYGANLRGADLGEANLYGADLHGAKGILVFGPGGSRGDMLYAVKHDDKIMWSAGCFWGDTKEFKAAIKETHGNNQYAKWYLACIKAAEIAFADNDVISVRKYIIK